jgi:nucleoid-associated protein YgaU
MRAQRGSGSRPTAQLTKRLTSHAVALALFGAAAFVPATVAQGQQLAPPPVDQAAEAALPDINALERGARPRASVSFAPPADGPGTTLPTLPIPGENATPLPVEAAAVAPIRKADPVRRITAPPPAGLVRRSGIYGLDALSGYDDQAPAANDDAAVAGDHVVRDGDTMTSVCEQYFSDPSCWPRLWSENPQVSNPHWIFPGDVIHLRGRGAAAPAVAPPPKPPTGMRVTSNRKGSLDSRGVLLRESGFIDKEGLAEAGHISGSREEKMLLASGDQAYVGFPKGKPLRAGILYTVFEADTTAPVKNPETGEILGYLVRVYGEIQIDQVADGSVARGTLSGLAEPVERGYQVSPRVRVFKTLEPKPATTNLEARVVASFSPTLMLAAENFVVLSRGSKDGIAVGNRIFVVRRGDGYRPVMDDWNVMDARFPKERVAELWVVDVRQGAAVAWVARSSKELRVGEVAELRKGY